jgi:peptidoglycan hydrolase-like protein with peptidoglycan-binding domain
VDDRGRGRSGSSAEIRQIQQELRNHGHDPGGVDGVWGPRTSNAVADFQRANGLQATGRIDPRTRQALAGSTSGGTAPTTPPPANPD